MYKKQFNEQKANAKKRNIQFDLTYEQWVEIWGDKISLRGVGKGKYCMSRIGDRGPYAKGNVEITLFEDNNRVQATNGKNALRNGIRPTNVPSKSNHYKTFPVEVIKKKEGILRQFQCLQDAADFYLVDKSTLGRNMRGTSNGAFTVRKI